MPGNRFGTIFTFTTWGESHGPAIGCVIDGAPPNIPLQPADIQYWLDQRRPGQSAHTSTRQETDQVQILSGVYEGKTTGTPISLLILNKDQHASDYDNLSQVFRPGHADFVYQQKYGIRDPRGGGRSSARETACRVAAGAVARLILKHQLNDQIHIQGCLVQIGPYPIDPNQFDPQFIRQNLLHCPDPTTLPQWEAYLQEVRAQNSSTGAMVQVRVQGMPPGLGEPVYDKLDADLAKALMSINAAKAVEIGDGLDVVQQRGEDHNDPLTLTSSGQPMYKSNHAGGIVGGLSTGQDIVIRCAFKPTSSIGQPQSTLTTDLQPTTITIQGRHDPCVAIRAVPVAEAMVACVLADHWLRHKAQCK